MVYLTLFDISQSLVSAWRSVFFDTDVSCVKLSLDEICKQSKRSNIPVCVVSPANSYGFMDGGIDGVISRICNYEITNIVRKDIAENFGGELLVGQATINEVNTIYNNKILICSAPTMRVPYSICNSDNVYNSFFAVLQTIYRYSNKNKKDLHVFCPGMGTGAGEINPTECARQMSLAYKNFMDGLPENWVEASERQSELGVI